MASARRLAAALGGLIAVTVLTTTSALAGNYAEVSLAPGDMPPTAGEERELRLTLLQHGVTPVDVGTVTLTAWLPGTGERLAVEATSLGGGEWIAALTFPTDGDWQMRVTHSVFETPEASLIAVAPAGFGWVPGALAFGAMGLIVVVLLVVAALLVRLRGSSVTEAQSSPARVG
jgi:hypothetical protein